MANLHQIGKICCGCLLLCLIPIVIIPTLHDRSFYIPLGKRHLHDFTEPNNVCLIPSLSSVEQFHNYFLKHGYACSDMRWFGQTDGRKAVCLDLELNITKGNCHVLSFGINNEWSFDDDFASYGCKVYSFDPTMGAADNQRSENVQFFNLGIGNIKGKREVGMAGDFDFFEVDRYENILQRLGLLDTPIDYIKLDVELSELEFLQDILRNAPHLLRNVKQIAMEAHHGYNGEGVMLSPVDFPDLSPMSAFQLFWQYFHELECHGFKLMHAHKNPPWTEAVWTRIPGS